MFRVIHRCNILIGLPRRRSLLHQGNIYQNKGAYVSGSVKQPVYSSVSGLRLIFVDILFLLVCRGAVLKMKNIKLVLLTAAEHGAYWVLIPGNVHYFRT